VLKTIKKAEVRRQKAEGVPTNEFGGFNKVATRLFFSINKFRGFKPYGREQRTYFCIKAYLLSFCPLPSALCLSSVKNNTKPRTLFFEQKGLLGILKSFYNNTNKFHTTEY